MAYQQRLDEIDGLPIEKGSKDSMKFICSLLDELSDKYPDRCGDCWFIYDWARDNMHNHHNCEDHLNERIRKQEIKIIFLVNGKKIIKAGNIFDPPSGLNEKEVKLYKSLLLLREKLRNKAEKPTEEILLIKK